MMHALGMFVRLKAAVKHVENIFMTRLTFDQSLIFIHFVIHFRVSVYHIQSQLPQN